MIITPALLVYFFWYKPHPTEHRRYVKDNVEAWLFWAAANVSISWGLALIVDIVPGVVRTIISLTWGHVSELVKSRIELYVSVKDTVKPVLYAASGWVSWVILFAHIFKLYDMDDTSESRASYTPRVSVLLSRAGRPAADFSIRQGVPSDRVPVLFRVGDMRPADVVTLHRCVSVACAPRV